MRLGCLHFLTPTKKCSLFQPNYNTHRHGNSGLSSHRSQMTTKCLSGHRTNQYSIFYRGWDCTRKTCPRVRIALTNYCTTLISSYTPKKENPLEVRGQRVFHRHRVQGRTDLVVLRTRRHGGPIIRNMVEFAIEIKTVAGPQKSRWLFVGSATSIDRAKCIQYTEIPSCCTVKPGEDTPCRLSRLQSGWMELCYQTEKMQHVCCCHSLREKGCRRTQYIV